MTSEQKVKQLWPKAKIERITDTSYYRTGCFMVTIAPGRRCYGRMRSWAWKNAWDSIVQDDELSKGAQGTRGEG